jgi:hypothetical protein
VSRCEEDETAGAADGTSERKTKTKNGRRETNHGQGVRRSSPASSHSLGDLDSTPARAAVSPDPTPCGLFGLALHTESENSAFVENESAARTRALVWLETPRRPAYPLSRPFQRGVAWFRRSVEKKSRGSTGTAPHHRRAVMPRSRERSIAQANPLDAHVVARAVSRRGWPRPVGRPRTSQRKNQPPGDGRRWRGRVSFVSLGTLGSFSSRSAIPRRGPCMDQCGGACGGSSGGSDYRDALT